MATSNITVTQSWVKLAADSDSTVLISFGTPVYYEVAATVADVAPTGLIGHQLKYDEALTRDIIGTGFIWARIVNAPETITSAVAIVTK